MGRTLIFYKIHKEDRMEFLTPERKRNLEWVEKNKDTIILKYDGKFILVENQSVIDSSTNEDELFNKAEGLGLNKESFIVLTVGSAIPKEEESGIWW